MLDWLYICLSRPATVAMLHSQSIKMRHTLGLLGLIAISRQATDPFGSLAILILSTGVYTLILTGVALLCAGIIDCWAQWRGAYTQLKPLFHGYAVAMLPMILYLPAHLLGNNLIVMLAILWSAYRYYAVIKHCYGVSRLTAIFLFMLPGLVIMLALAGGYSAYLLV